MMRLEIKIPIDSDKFYEIMELLDNRDNFKKYFLQISGGTKIIEEYFSSNSPTFPKLESVYTYRMQREFLGNFLFDGDDGGTIASDSKFILSSINQKSIEGMVKQKFLFTEISNPDAIRSMLQQQNIKTSRIVKKTIVHVHIGYMCNVLSDIKCSFVHLENGKTFFVTTHTGEDFNDAIAADHMIDIIEFIGLDPVKRDSRPWEDIIA